MVDFVNMLLLCDFETMLGIVVWLMLAACASGLVICLVVWSAFQAYDLLANISERG